MRIGKRSLEDLAKRWAKGRENGAPVTREIVWDDELPGFGVRRQVVGDGATFVLKYRVKGDKRQRWWSLGEWPAVAPDPAREAAREIKQAATLGRDLVAERKVEASRIAAELEEQGRLGIPLARILDAWREATAEELRRAVEGRQAGTHQREMLRLEARFLRPALASATVGSFDPEQLQTVLDRATSRSAALNIRTAISRFLRFGRAWLREQGVRVEWKPSFEINQPSVRARDHRYSLEEAASLWLAAGEMGRRGALVRMLLLTGLRRSEVALLRRSQVSLDDPVLGAHVVLEAVQVKHRRQVRQPLSAAAVALLRWLPARDSRRFGEAELVFAGRANRPVGGWTDIRRELLRLAKVPDGTLHDVRRTIVSELGDRGWEPAVVDRVLNHAAAATMSGVMGVYQRSELWESKRRALEAWAELLLTEAARLQRRGLDRETWGLDEPFQDARIRRPRRPRAAAASA